MHYNVIHLTLLQCNYIYHDQCQILYICSTYDLKPLTPLAFSDSGSCDANSCSGNGACGQMTGKFWCVCNDGFNGPICASSKCVHPKYVISNYLIRFPMLNLGVFPLIYISTLHISRHMGQVSRKCNFPMNLQQLPHIKFIGVNLKVVHFRTLYAELLGNNVNQGWGLRWRRMLRNIQAINSVKHHFLHYNSAYKIFLTFNYGPFSPNRMIIFRFCSQSWSWVV